MPKPRDTPLREEVRRLLREYRATRDPAIRDRLVELNSDLVRYIARRFANRGEPLEDIEQVGFLGLIQAIDRFDPSLENEFSTFATPTIMGEIRRHFRDRSWAVRVPRRLQENLLRVHAAQQELQGRLGRPASIEEIAAHLGLQPDDMGMMPGNLLGAFKGAARYMGLRGNIIVAVDYLFGLTKGQDWVGSARPIAMAHLSPRERRIMALRFIEQLPQTEVAKRLGISQMHVSRLQRAAVEHLRQEFGDEVLV